MILEDEIGFTKAFVKVIVLLRHGKPKEETKMVRVEDRNDL